MRFRDLACALLLLAGGPLLAFAQVTPSDTGRVTGFVWTADNSPVVGATVQLRDTMSGKVFATTQSDATGEFTFTAPSGAYVVELIGADGRAVTVSSPLALAAGDTIATFVRVGNLLPVVMSTALWEVSFGPHILRQNDATHAGGAVALGYVTNRVTTHLQAGWTRRDGHNDWRALAGPRVALTDGGRISLFVHGLAGVVIRNSESRFAWAAGGGANIRSNGRLGVRLQLEALSDTGGRASAWVVIR